MRQARFETLSPCGLLDLSPHGQGTSLPLPCNRDLIVYYQSRKEYVVGQNETLPKSAGSGDKRSRRPHFCLSRAQMHMNRDVQHL